VHLYTNPLLGATASPRVVPIDAHPIEYHQRLGSKSVRKINHGSEHGVSIIVFEDALHQVKSMIQADAWFKQQNRPVEFTVVSKSGSRVVPLSGEIETKLAPNLEAAIEKSRYEQIAVLDAVYQFDAVHWNLVDPQGNRPAFRSWSYSATLRQLNCWL